MKNFIANPSRVARGMAAVLGCAVPMALVGAVASGGCAQNPTLPGTSLGNYNIVGTLETNTCGTSIGAVSPWDFTIELSEVGTTIYLANTDGSGELTGSVTATSTTTPSTATLAAALTSNVDATEAGAGTCNLTQTTTWSLTLAAGSPPPTLMGSVSYGYDVDTTIATDTDCTDQLSTFGGPYSTLPCTVTYSLTATRQ